MNRPRDLRWAILGSFVLLGAIVVVGIIRPPPIRRADPVGGGSEPDGAPAVSDNAVFPLRSKPRGPTRALDDSFQPTVGEEDGEPIVF